MFKCPKCNSQIYNRKLSFCTTCYAPLPDDMKMNKEQIEILEEEKRISLEKARKYHMSKYRGYDLEVYDL